jgi:hypothetical protein
LHAHKCTIVLVARVSMVPTVLVGMETSGVGNGDLHALQATTRVTEKLASVPQTTIKRKTTQPGVTDIMPVAPIVVAVLVQLIILCTRARVATERQCGAQTRVMLVAGGD